MHGLLRQCVAAPEECWRPGTAPCTDVVAARTRPSPLARIALPITAINWSELLQNFLSHLHEDIESFLLSLFFTNLGNLDIFHISNLPCPLLSRHTLVYRHTVP